MPKATFNLCAYMGLRQASWTKFRQPNNRNLYQSSSESAKISSKSRREVKNTEDQNTEHRDADSVTEHKRQVNVREE